jgi:hypothetical protein
MSTLTWKKLNPSGIRPLRVDKLSSWIYGSKVYLFGGFGPPPEPEKDDLPNFVTHAVDPSTLQWGGRNIRGWTNQLVVYNISTNSWEWPQVAGLITYFQFFVCLSRTNFCANIFTVMLWKIHVNIKQ